MRLLLGSIAGAAILGATTAQAAVTVSTLPGPPDPGPLFGETKVITFDSGTTPAGVTLVGDAAVVSGSVDGQYAAPAGDTTPYLTTPYATSDGASELDFGSFLGNQDVRQFSFYWGSIDTYNTLQLLDRAGNSFYSISGADLPVGSNSRVVFNLTGPDQNLGGLLFTSTSKAFEVDTFSFAAVPEPATWAMMLVGFGGLGAMLRSRRRAGAALA